MKRFFSIALALALASSGAWAGTFEMVTISGAPMCHSERALKRLNATGHSHACAPMRRGAYVYVATTTTEKSFDLYAGKVVDRRIAIGYLVDPSRSGVTHSLILYQYGMLYFNQDALFPKPLPKIGN